LAATTITSASWPSKSPTATETVVRPNRNPGLSLPSFTYILTGAGARSGYRTPTQTANLEAAAAASSNAFNSEMG
jgi:hypothetical protein